LGGEEVKAGLPGNTYALVHDPKKFSTFAEYKCIKNGENFNKIPSEVCDRDEVSVNIKAIA
jgi:hypothetical protein